MYNRIKKSIASSLVAISLIVTLSSTSMAAIPEPVSIVLTLAFVITRWFPVGPSVYLPGSTPPPSSVPTPPDKGPAYYNFDDLKNAINENKSSFFFDRSGPTGDMVAVLPPSPPENSDSGIYPANKIKAQFLTLPWDNLPLRKGDVILMRGDDILGRAIGLLSSFTHAAIVHDKPRHYSFESAGDGVKDYRAGDAWGKKVVTFAVKRIKYLPQWQIENAVDDAYNRYKGVPYFPYIHKSAMNRDNWLREWMNKSKGSSMYCSKLVWWTFSNKGVDLDTNYTKSYRYGDSRGNWMGVSPDDVYRSTAFARDMYCVGQENLGRRFDSIF